MRKGIKLFVVLAVILVLLFSACQGKDTGGGNAQLARQYGPPMNFAVGSTSAAEDLITRGIYEYKRLLEERSGGAMTMDVFPASQMGNALNMIEMISAGSMDMLVEANFFAMFGVDHSLSITFGLRDLDDVKYWYASDFFKEGLELFREMMDIRIICHNWYRPWAIIVSKKPAYTQADFRGLKLRTTGADTGNRVFAALGFAPTPIAYNETLLALQQGVIDAAFIVEDAAYTMGWYEVTNYLLQTNQTIDSLLLYFSNKRWQGMTEAQRELLVQCAHDAGDWYTAGTDESVRRAYEGMKAKGIQVISYSQEERESWFQQIIPIYRDLEASGRYLPGSVDRYLRIRNREE